MISKFNTPVPSFSLELRILMLMNGFWLFWLGYNYFSGYFLHLGTYFLIIGALVSFSLGWGMTRIKYLSGGIRIPLLFVGLRHTEKRTLKFLNFVVLLYLVFLIPALKSLLTLGFEHRDAVFEKTGIFGSELITLFVRFVINPLVIVAAIVAVAASNSERSYMRYAYTLTIMLALFSLGRFPIYYLLFFYIVNRLISGNAIKSDRFINLRTLVVIMVLLFCTVVFSNFKVGSEDRVFALSDLIKIYFIDYHVVGFHMLDYAINVDDSRLLDFEFPTTSLGSVGWLLHHFTKYIHVIPLFDNSFIYAMEIFDGGMYFDELNWSYNAFTTGLLPLYLDGGYVGVFGIVFLYGMLSGLPKGLSFFHVNPYFLLVIFLMMFSLFQPITSFYLLSSLVLMFLFITYLRLS